MGFFNFIETFFFISLAITFILIIMLVYHFKDRLSILEDKTNTLMDIMNNMVKEMMIIKNRPFYVAPSPSLAPTCMHSDIPPTTSSEASGINFTPLVPMMSSMFGSMFANKIVVSDDDSDGSSSDDESNGDNVVDTDDEDEIKNFKLTDKKLETVDILEDILQIDLSSQIDDSINDKSNEVEVMKEISITEEESINTESKVEETIIEEEGDTTVIDLGEQKNTLDIYKNMEISKLKSLVLEKGLSQDVKNMKKNGLIKLLTESVQ